MVKKVYVCSRYRGDVERNVEHAIRYENFVIAHGYRPIVPHLHLTKLLDDNEPMERDMGLQFGKLLIELCDEMWVFGDSENSEGMQGELEYWRHNKNGCKISYYDTKLNLIGEEVNGRS